MPDTPAQPGDLVFFAGRGFVSRVIALRTCSFRQLFTRRWISHVGIVFRYEGSPFVCESTTLCPWPCYITQKQIDGVQAHPLKQRTEAYDGRVWLARLNTFQRLNFDQINKLGKLVAVNLGTPYDQVGAVICGTEIIKRWFHGGMQRAFCSELCAWILRQLGVQVEPPGVRSDTVSPAGLARNCDASELYQDLELLK